ncbi:MAG: hypothetical protein HYV63_33320, partial [Candidatus Schekmanbacteria bacterium]|nr:hypothetical protein [Candidatus Schekmanbacteria bacterium]
IAGADWINCEPLHTHYCGYKGPTQWYGLLEGWAEFYNHAALDKVGMNINGKSASYCTSYSATSTSCKCTENWNPLPASGSPNYGAYYENNVTMAFMDWLDKANDDHSVQAGAGDYFVASDGSGTMESYSQNQPEGGMYSVWYNLDQMWSYFDGQSCMGICEYTEYYIQERKGGSSSYELMIGDLMRNNGIGCDLPHS